MKMCTGFWLGMGAGLVIGAAADMMVQRGKSPKTQVGKSIHNLGVAVDHAVDNIVSELH